jgi:hypothetical protein
MPNGGFLRNLPPIRFYAGLDSVATAGLQQAQIDAVIMLLGSLEGPEEAGAGLASRAAIPWSSRVVREAAQALARDATDVTVGSRSQAEELFLGYFQGNGYRNSTGMSPREAKEFFGGKAGTYHWDIGEAAYPHDMSHLQIHTLQGPVVRIYFPD